MTKRRLLQNLNIHKWRHSAYVTELYNVYVREKSVHLPTNHGGTEAQAHRRKLEFYSRMCGKIIQHLEKQSKSPTSQGNEASRWTYSGLFFTVIHNFHDIHQKDLVVLLVALTKIIRDGNSSANEDAVLRHILESFMASLMISGDAMIMCVNNIANRIEPTMNKWKYFANLMHMMGKIIDQPKESLGKDDGHYSTISEPAEHSSDHVTEQPPITIGLEDAMKCVANKESQSLLANLILRLTQPKDFARICSVLYWLRHSGFPYATLKTYCHLLINRMQTLPLTECKEQYPRDIISVLKYSLGFELPRGDNHKLYGYLSKWNRESMLRLSLQDASSLLDCFLEAGSFDKGLLISILVNLQLCLSAENSSKHTDKANLLRSYLSEKNRNNSDEDWNLSNMVIDFTSLNELADRFIEKDALSTFLRGNISDKYYVSRHQGNNARGSNLWSKVIEKLEKLCPALKETRHYCNATIEYLKYQKHI